VKKIQWILLPVLMTLLFLPVFWGVFLLFSTSGLTTALKLAADLIPGELTVGRATGRLADHFTLQDLRFTDGESTVTIKNITVIWAPSALMSRTLLIRNFAVDGMDVRLPTEQTRGKKSDGLPLDLPPLPISVRIERASLESTAVSMPGQPEPEKIDSIVLEDIVGQGTLLHFGRFAVAAPSYAVEASGAVGVEKTVTVNLNADFSYTPGGYGTISGKGNVSGSLEEMNITASLKSPCTAAGHGKIRNFLSGPAWEAEVLTDHVSLSDINADWPRFDFSSLRADGKGTFAAYTVQIETDTVYTGFKNIHLVTQLSGDGSGLGFSDSLLRSADGMMTGKGKLNWENRFVWEVSAAGTRLSVPELHTGWPEIILQKYAVEGHGEEDRYTFRVEADGQYKGIQGIIHAVTSITGNGDGLRLSDTVLEHGETEISGKVQLGWREFFSWEGDLTGKRLDPGLLDPQFPGSLDVRLLTKGKTDNGTTGGRIELLSLDGVFRGYPLTANGTVQFDGNNFSLDHVLLQTQGTSLKASGQVAETVSIDFQAESSDLRVAWPELTGNIQAGGSIRGKRKQPVVNLNFLGEGITGYGNSIGRVEGQIAADLTPGGAVDASIRASSILAVKRTIDFLQADLHGKVEEHTVQLEASAGGETVTVQGTGSLAEGVWTGWIKQALINLQPLGVWHLRDSAALKISGGRVEMDNICLAGKEDALACLAGSYREDGEWRISSQARSIPLSMLQQGAAMELRPSIHGTLSGEITIAGIKGNIGSGEMNLKTDHASVLLPLSDKEKHEIVWRENGMHVVVTENRLTAELRSILRDGSSVAASLAINDFTPFSTPVEKMTIEGSIHLNIEKLDQLSALTFPIAEPSGSLIGSVNVSGAVGSPLFSGSAKIAGGEVVVPRMGITVENLSVLLEGDDRLVKLHLTGNSGRGTILAEGSVSPTSGATDTVSLAISGNDFEAVNTPELHLFVSPKIDMLLNRKRTDLKGTIRITDGMISPSSLAGSVSPSRDVVFVKPDKQGNVEELPVSAELSIIVEQKVQIDAFGLKGRLAGAIHVTDLPGKIATGTGNLDVKEGSFTVYGRELQIKTGQLLFSGGPIDNPGISVQAENTTKGVTAGIAVSGFLREPEISFYSQPPMEENEIISRLFMNTSLLGADSKESGFIGSVAAKTGIAPLGSALRDVKKALRVDDIKMEAGKTSEDMSLVIGTWMTPSLYISYGKNLLKDSGSFNSRYILGHGFSLETETGSTESGVDVKYEIGQ